MHPKLFMLIAFHLEKAVSPFPRYTKASIHFRDKEK